MRRRSEKWVGGKWWEGEVKNECEENDEKKINEWEENHDTDRNWKRLNPMKKMIQAETEKEWIYPMI